VKPSAIAAVLLAISGSTLSGQEAPPDLESPRPIDAVNTVYLEEMTWMEVRDAMRAGKTTVIIPTGGVEPNGPYLALGKHNYILRATTERIARRLGDALVTPTVPFVPEGDIEPPTGHMRYWGTLSVTQSTFRALLTDIAHSLKMHGFRHIVLIGDSGGNQSGMRAVADSLNQAWQGSGTSVHFIPEYYDNPRWNKWIADQGIKEIDQGLHDDFRHSSIMMSVDPTTVRTEQRIKAGLFSINSVQLAPADQTIKVANALVDYQTDVTVAAIRKAISR
jgi:creatinine amidohydrolase